MIVSHRHRFIFVKGLKVAGTSVEIALSRICGQDDIITPISPADERYRLGTEGQPRNYSGDLVAEGKYIRAIAEAPIGTVRLPKSAFYNHMPLAEVLRRVPEAKAYTLLFVERSPYQKVFSFANWCEHRRAYDEGGSLPQAPAQMQRVVDRLIDDGSILNVRNIDLYRDASGNIVSEGWRFERLRDQLNAFLRECGTEPPQMVHAKRGLDSSGLDVRTILRPAQIAWINQAFAEEFQIFGYEPL